MLDYFTRHEHFLFVQLETSKIVFYTYCCTHGDSGGVAGGELRSPVANGLYEKPDPLRTKKGLTRLFIIIIIIIAASYRKDLCSLDPSFFSIAGVMCTVRSISVSLPPFFDSCLRFVLHSHISQLLNSWTGRDWNPTCPPCSTSS